MGRFIEDFDQLDKQLGTLVREWAGLELILAALFAALVSPNSERHISLFYAIVSNQARAELMRKALLFSGQNVHERKATEAIIAKFQKLNKARNRYVHAVYAMGEGHVIRADFTAGMRVDEGVSTHGGLTPVNASEIANHVSAVAALARETQDFLRDNGKLPSGWQ